MWVRQLQHALVEHGDVELAKTMAAYMRNQFAFLGIPTQLRRQLCKPHFAQAKKEGSVRWSFIDACWNDSYREFQYVAADYLALKQSSLTANDVPRIRLLIVSRSWWDTVDTLDKMIGEIALRDPTVTETLLQWSRDENIWLRRVAIDHQLRRKEQTDTALLEQIIENNLGTTEFFINKAIGWSLREYSKTNPAWVRAFLTKYGEQLSSLSIREAGKYL